MTLLDLPQQSPRLVCGINPPSWGTHAPLGCILDMGHEGRVHQDRMGRTWELLSEFTPRQHHIDVVQRLLALEEGTLQLLDRLAAEVGDWRSVEVARFEHRRVHDTLVAMGLADEEPQQKPAPAERDACPRCFRRHPGVCDVAPDDADPVIEPTETRPCGCASTNDRHALGCRTLNGHNPDCDYARGVSLMICKCMGGAA